MFEEILHRTFLGNRILDYVFASLLFVGGLLVIWVARKIVLRRIQKWTARTKTTVDDFLLSMVQKTLLPLLYFCAFYIASQSLTLNPAIRKAIFGLGVVLLTIFMYPMTSTWSISIVGKRYSRPTSWYSPRRIAAARRTSVEIGQRRRIPRGVSMQAISDDQEPPSIYRPTQ